MGVELELKSDGEASTDINAYLDRFQDQQSAVREAFQEAGLPVPEPGEGDDRRLNDAASQHSHEQNMLFGLLGLQTSLVSREDLLAAVGVWLEDKSQSISEILLQRNAITADERQLLEALVGKHLAKNEGDAEKSLAALSSLGSVSDDLRSLGDAELDATLLYAGKSESQDPRLAETFLGQADGTASATPASDTTSRFRILRPHARGGLGEVSVAQDQELNREVALKEIKKQYADDVNSRSRFMVEAEITGRLEHPGIVPVYGLGQYADGRPFYAMGFIRGDSLEDAADQFHEANDAKKAEGTTDESSSTTRVSGFESVAFRKLLGRFVDVCNAVGYAHSRGVLHRDLKPGNIMLGKYGETLVVDWGLAKAQGRSERHTELTGEQTLQLSSGSGSAPTQMGSAIGTPAYMPPEQATGALDELGPASDVYSLGATLYYLLTGQPPVKGKSLNDTLQKVCSGDFPRPRTINRSIPASLEAICLQSMALKPHDRYASLQNLADDVERYLADERVSVHRESLSERLGRYTRKHRIPIQIAGVAALLISIISIGAAFFTSQAWQSEFVQRTRAERKEAEAVRLQGVAEDEKRAAQAAERRERLRLARSYLDNGITHCDEGDVPRGMLFFAEALHSLPENNPDLERVIRLNLSNWAREFHHLELAAR